MKKLFFIGALLSAFSAVMCADSEKECLYKGTDVTCKDVIREEMDCLTQVVQASAQANYFRPLLSEVNIDHLPQGSLLRARVQESNKLVQNIFGKLNEQLMLNIAGIHNHFAEQKCLCDQCKSSLREDDISHLVKMNELYLAFQKVISDEYKPKSPFLLEEIRFVLPEKSLWKQQIDEAVQEKESTKSTFRNEFDKVVGFSCPQFYDPFADSQK